jgi:hypothetical protein
MMKPVDGPLLVGDTTLILPTSILAPTELARLLLPHVADLSHDIENIRILQESRFRVRSDASPSLKMVKS